MLGSLDQLELYAKGSKWACCSGKSATRCWKRRMAGVQKQAAWRMWWPNPTSSSALLPSSRPISNATNLEGKTLITSAVDDERLAFFTKCKVNLVIDVSPKLFPERVVGINTH